MSFCVTCMGRLHHLKKTLRRNLLWNQDYGSLEFVILDYNSSDGLGDWVRRTIMPQLASGRVVYFRESTARFYEEAHAKNVSVRVATGDIICNADADVYLGCGFARHLDRVLGDGPGAIATPPIHHPPGYSGTVAMKAGDFRRLGGYDERLCYGWGHVDGDLVDRAIASGMARAFHDRRFCIRPVWHSDRERVRLARVPDKQESLRRHLALCRESMEKCEYVANQGRAWGAARLLKNFEEEVVLT